ncbi:MAG: hypothetical protein IJG56_00905, partial [Clostridia bacterium]|nr:hypothetical protein [Clostridia bacterium]
RKSIRISDPFLSREDAGPLPPFSPLPVFLSKNAACGGRFSIVYSNVILNKYSIFSFSKSGKFDPACMFFPGEKDLKPSGAKA